MNSQNFEFLRQKRSVLADLAAFAERYAHDDPASSLIKQRTFVEHAVTAIYERYRLQPPFSDNLNDLMIAEAFRQSVPEIVQNKLHTVRKAGNHAAHPRRPITSQRSLECLAQLFDIALWFHIQVDGGDRGAPHRFVPPPPEADRSARTREALERLRLTEAKYDSVLAALEEETKRRLDAERAATEHATELAQLKLKDDGQNVAMLLQFDEEATRRRLIDQGLVAAGWNVGLNGANTEQVRQEVRLSTMPTDSGEGYADYVLYGDDGKPLAVVEAKRTAKDVHEGAEQARIYAGCLERETGVRPVIFFTNGPDIFIWDDVQGYPYRKLYGFYSKDSLEYLTHQRSNKRPLATVAPNLAIADRMYQLEAVKRVGERFSTNFRKALLVQATGTGKTRIAVSLCDVLMRAGWVKRILFLCDRRELRRQADRVFKEFMPGEPRVVVGANTAGDRDKRIYLATYPAMMKCLEDFDVGFFDLVIADESHRSIYKKFRGLFQYFDALQVGLTATPVRFIERNTYELFDCEDRDPTSHFSFEDAVTAGFLAPFRVRAFSSQFREKGLRYADMSEAQRAELEDQEPAAQQVDYDADDLDEHVFNRDTTRYVWRTLMDEGIRDETGSQVGKTIVFARSHVHAQHLADVFSEMYPQYGSTFCRVIDNQEPRAEQLIDDFKNPDSELTIAISVDMLDTGIDVPEVVNLVLAKPVKSYVKFWQMIGRGTRLRRNLFGPGRDKTEFLIFDHWSNFWFFDEKYKERQPSPQKSLLQHLFEARIELAQAALDKMEEDIFQGAAALIIGDVRAARDTNAIDARDRWRELEMLADGDRVHHFAAATQADLLSIAAPLQRLRNVRGEEDAYRFDLLITRLQLELVKGGPDAPKVQDLRARVQEAVELLAKNQNPVKAKADAIKQVRSKEFWLSVQVHELEGLRSELRGIMKYQQPTPSTRVAPQVFDVTDADFSAETYIPRLEGLDLVEYKRRVESVLREHFAENPILQCIRAGQPVREDELEELARLVLQVDDKANVKHLAGRDPDTRRSLLTVFRSLVGLDAAAVEKAFMKFVHEHPRLTSPQLRFLQVLQNHIAQNGGIEIERLYEPPFTTIHTESVDGVFPVPGDVDDLLTILSSFEPKRDIATEPAPASRVS